MVVNSTISELQKWQTPIFGVAFNFLITGGPKCVYVYFSTVLFPIPAGHVFVSLNPSLHSVLLCLFVLFNRAVPIPAGMVCKCEPVPPLCCTASSHGDHEIQTRYSPPWWLEETVTILGSAQNTNRCNNKGWGLGWSIRNGTDCSVSCWMTAKNWSIPCSYSHIFATLQNSNGCF